MKLEDMKRNLIDMEHEERYAFLLSYFEVRNKVLQEVQVKMNTRKSPGEGKKKEKLVTVSSNQLTLLKQLGLI